MHYIRSAHLPRSFSFDYAIVNSRLGYPKIYALPAAYRRPYASNAWCGTHRDCELAMCFIFALHIFLACRVVLARHGRFHHQLRAVARVHCRTE
jgi:hypothetical protein